MGGFLTWGRLHSSETISVALALFLASCGTDGVQPGDTYPAGYKLSLGPSLLFLGFGKSFQLSFDVRDANGLYVTDPPVTFNSDHVSILAISDSGLVKSLAGAADVVVTATAKNLTAQILVRVLPTLATAGRTVLQDSGFRPPVGIAIYGNVVLATQLAGSNIGSLSRAVLPSFSFGSPLLWGGNPEVVVFDSGGTRAFVPGTPSLGATTISLPSGAVVDSVPTFTFTDDAFDAVLSTDGGTLYVATADGKIFAMNSDSLQDETVLVAFPKVANHIIRHPSLPLLYVSGGTTVEEVSAQNGAVIRSFSFQTTTQGIALSSDGSRLYVALEGNGDIGSLVVWDLTANQLIKSVDAYGSLFDVALTPDGTTLLVSEANFGKIYVFSTSTLDFTSMYEVGGAPRRLAMTFDGSTTAVTNLGGWVDFIR